MAEEIELKFRVGAGEPLRRKLRRLGFRVKRKATRERNWLFDDREGKLKAEGKLLRLRQMGDQWLLTAKGPRLAGLLKRRREAQTYVQEGERCRAALELAGMRVTGYYAVRRTLWARAGEGGEIAWDQTARGTFLEIEGTARWVRATAAELGLNPREAEPRSYAELLQASDRAR